MEEMEMDLDMGEMEEGDERQNRTFMLLVAVMGGILLIGIAAFCAWVLIVGRGLLGGQVAVAPTVTPTIEMTVPEATATPGGMGAAEVTIPPPTPTTETPPSPTPTMTLQPRQSPSPEATRPGTPVGVAQVTPTIGPRQVQTPAPPTATRTPATASAPAQTGIGAFTAVLLAAGLFLLLIVARRLRTAH